MQFNIFTSLFKKSKERIERRFDFVKPVSSTYCDVNKSKIEKIILEKRRRNQAYMTLDYILSLSTCFDFFSKDAFQIVLGAKYYGQICEKQVITPEFILLSLFNLEIKTRDSLIKYNLNASEISSFVLKLNGLTKSSSTKFKAYLNNFLTFFTPSFLLKKVSFNKEIEFSYDLINLFEKATENAISRFKTPVVTSDILFITLMEERTSKVGKFLIKLLKTDANWYLLRYNLLKHIHYHESTIRSEISDNHQYFAYLLKTQLSDMEFDRLLEKEAVGDEIILFRNTLLTQVLQLNLYEFLNQDIKRSMKFTRKISKRKYST